jgi:hypothetical protein
MCKKMVVIPINRVVDKKRIIGKNGGPRKRRGIADPKTTKNVRNNVGRGRLDRPERSVYKCEYAVSHWLSFSLAGQTSLRTKQKANSVTDPPIR